MTESVNRRALPDAIGDFSLEFSEGEHEWLIEAFQNYHEACAARGNRLGAMRAWRAREAVRVASLEPFGLTPEPEASPHDERFRNEIAALRALPPDDDDV